MKWQTDNTRIPILSWCENVEKGALDQAINLAELQVTYKHVALMPDCHVGYGMPIGGVIGCMNAVIPNAVGVDIGCGVVAVELDYEASRLTVDQIKKILGDTRHMIPTGFLHHKQAQAWDGFDKAPLQCPPVRGELESARTQLGTLGGGNHFLEIQTGDDGHVWMMLHSGSRNFGLKIAEYYHSMAAGFCEKQKVRLSSKDLAYFPADSEEGQNYMAAMTFAMAFARQNRELMMARFVEVAGNVLKTKVVRSINIHHNYCRKEQHFSRELYVHRKGATSAKKGEWGVVPGSMGTASYVVQGLGNPDSFESCSHGAGRCMGRNQANRHLSEEECTRSMDGIVFGRWSRDRKGNVDLSEAPQAYKPIDEVMAAQSDLVSIMVRLKPAGVIKG